MKRKIQTYEIILCIFVLAVVAAGLLMPKTGSLVMIDEICDIVAVWTVCIYVIVRIIQSRGRFQASVKAVRILVIAACVVIGVLFTRSTALDLVSGPETAQLTDIQVSRSQAYTGIFSLHYYLTGTDSQGKRVRLEISGDDYTRLSESSSVMVEYYKYTGRIIRYFDRGEYGKVAGTWKTEKTTSVELTQRKRELLEEMGLPSDYDKLTDTQKNAATAIEAMLLYLEGKYQEEFCYLSYAEAGILEKEHLEAYPAMGTPSDVVTVYRTYKDGEYHYEDDYANIGVRPIYESRVREFAVQSFPESGIKVFSDIRNSGQGTGGQSVTEENVLQTVSAVTYIFISESVCTEAQFRDFTEECAQWMESQCKGAAAQICLRLTDAGQWELINASGYEDKLRENIFLAEAECAVSASGKLSVY